MDIEQSFVTYLKTVTELSTVGSRIYPAQLPKKPTYPAITYSYISESETETLRTIDENLISSVFEFSSWAPAEAQSRTIAKAIWGAFKNFQGEMGGTNGVYVSSISKINKFADTERDNDGVVIVCRTAQEFEITHRGGD